MRRREYNKEIEAAAQAYREFDVLAPTPTAFVEHVLIIWSEHVPVVKLFGYSVFKYSDFSGQIIDVDWLAVDVLLKFAGIKPSAVDIDNFRIAARAYIDAINDSAKTTD